VTPRIQPKAAKDVVLGESVTVKGVGHNSATFIVGYRNEREDGVIILAEVAPLASSPDCSLMAECPPDTEVMVISR
jgi:hypothetical protein